MISRGATRRRTAACVAALLVAPPVQAAPAAGEAKAQSAPADDPQAEAQRLFEAGSEAYNLGNFAVAIEKFEAAYSLTRATSLLYNIAQTYTKRYEVDPDPAYLRKAKVLFENFAKISESSGEDPRDARARAAALEQQLRAEPAEEPAPALETAAPGPAPGPAAPAPAAPPPRPLYRPGGVGVAGYALVGAGLVAGTAMATIGLVSADRLQAQRASEGALVPLPKERLDLYADNLDRARGLGFAGVGVGAGLLVVGVALVVIDAVRGRSEPRRASLRPLPGGLHIAF